MVVRVLWTAVWCCLVGLAEGANPKSKVTVVPVDPVSFDATVGHKPTTEVVVFTLTNSGRGVVRWTAGVDTDWAELSPASGVLMPHRRMDLTVSVGDTTLLKSGAYTGTLGVTNLSGEQPPQLRFVTLRVTPDATVRLAAPVLAALPLFTRGTSNTLFWTPVPGANEYRVQASASPDFVEAVSSRWLPGTNHTFHCLSDGVSYHYRVQCRSNSSAWSQTLSDQFATNENRRVSTRTQPGDVVLEGNTNRIWFEDFESPGMFWTNTLFNDLSLGAPLSRWEKGPMESGTFAPDTTPPLPINQRGDQEGRLYAVDAYHRYAYMTNLPENVSRDVTVDAFLGLGVLPQHHIVSAGVVLRADPSVRNTFLGGNGYAAIIQADGSSDRLLNILSLNRGILYGHVPLPANRFPVERPDESYHLRFAARGPYLTSTLWRIGAVNGIVVETPVALGNGTNVQSVRDIAYAAGVVGLTGIAWSDLNVSTNSAFFDDVTIVAHDGPAHYLRDGVSFAAVTPPSWFYKWGRLDFSASHPDSSTALTVDVLNARGVVLVTNVQSGSDLGAIPSVSRMNSLRLRANLSSTDPANSPALSDWTISYYLPEENASQSAWSDSVVSTQDNNPPDLRIVAPAASEVTVSNAAFTLQGTAFDGVSGLERVRVLVFAGFRVQDLEVETSNGFADWTLRSNLLPGTNTFRVRARDKAVPANVAIVTVMVVYRPPAPVELLEPMENRFTYGSADSAALTDLSPRLHVFVANGTVVLSWNPAIANARVEIATTLAPPDWTDMGERTPNPFTFPLTGSSRYFRLRPR